MAVVCVYARARTPWRTLELLDLLHSIVARSKEVINLEVFESRTLAQRWQYPAQGRMPTPFWSAECAGFIVMPAANGKLIAHHLNSPSGY